ncbi:MAG TPA: hypothetical protein VHC63_04235 [Acidimicrobiales bacterium]|nr:hypothetical protein [Acidimicrobiales bacterium]
MRARSFFVTSFAIAAFIGSAGVAQAHPSGPGNIESKPTATTVPPKGPGNIAPKPTTPTTTPPAPKGPGDLANTPSNPVVDPQPQPQPKPADNGSVVPADHTGDNVVVGAPQVTTEPQAPVAADASATPVPDASESHVPTIAVVLVAGVVGALMALLFARLRRDDDHADRV